MSSAFPKRRATDNTAEIGVNALSTVINDDFGWIFRRTHEEHDFGIDGYIDHVTSDGSVTGKVIAVQIKTGKSYLSAKGINHWYSDSKAHLNYYLNSPMPVLIVICDPRSRECYWALLDRSKVELQDHSWRHPVPKSQKLCRTQMGKIEPIFGEVEDHVFEHEQDMKLVRLASEGSLFQYSIPRSDIEDKNISNLRAFLNRLTRTEQLVLSVDGKLCISVAGYENDERELFEIREVRRWAKKARKKISEWYLCTNEHPRLSTLKWIALCTCKNTYEWKTKPDGSLGYLIMFDSEELSEFVEECYEGLNIAAAKWGWSEDYIYKKSKAIFDELVQDTDYPAMK